MALDAFTFVSNFFLGEVLKVLKGQNVSMADYFPDLRANMAPSESEVN